jgi:hypothetical protein
MSPYGVNGAQRDSIAAVQVFKTERRGWGIRTLCDIPKGMYCTTFWLNCQLSSIIGRLFWWVPPVQVICLERAERSYL